MSNLVFCPELATHARVFWPCSVQQMLTFFSRTFIKRTEKGSRQTVQHEEYNCHVYLRADGLGICAVADMEYPQRVAFTFMGKLMEEYTAEFT